MAEYIRNFEMLASQAKRTPEEAILGYFITGLRKTIKDAVRVQDPTRLVKAMGIARRIEEMKKDSRDEGQASQRLNGVHFRSSGVVTQNGSRNDPMALKER